jgi:hypothetical protein
MHDKILGEKLTFADMREYIVDTLLQIYLKDMQDQYKLTTEYEI